MHTKPKVMLHTIMPNQISGPNVSNQRLAASFLSEHYEFEFLRQTFHAGGKINLGLIRDLTQQIRAFRPDIIHISGLQASGFHAAAAARLAGVPRILVTVRGFSGDAIGISRIKRFLFTNIFEPLTLKFADRITTVCHEASNRIMIKRCEKKFAGVINNAAPIIFEDVLSGRDSIRRQFSAGEKDILIAISGRMVYDKGLAFISEAIENMDLSGKKFIFIGDGDYCGILRRKHKEAIAGQQVFVLGKVNNVIEVLAACDVFLFASLHENLSNALLEACSVGLPVVATNVGGNPEVVEDGVNGFLIPPENTMAIKDKLEYLCTHKQTRELFSQNSKLLIQEKFSQKLIYSQFHKLYQSMLKDKEI